MSAQDKILKDKTDIIRLKDLSCDEVCSFIETVKKKHCYTDDVILFRKTKDIYGNYCKVQIPKSSNILLC